MRIWQHIWILEPCDKHDCTCRRESNNLFLVCTLSGVTTCKIFHPCPLEFLLLPSEGHFLLVNNALVFRNNKYSAKLKLNLIVVCPAPNLLASSCEIFRSVVGEVDEELDSRLDMSKLRAHPLKPVIH